MSAVTGCKPAAHEIEGLAEDNREHDDRRQKQDAADDCRPHETRDRFHPYLPVTLSHSLNSDDGEPTDCSKP
jgi:hypothetical protein